MELWKGTQLTFCISLSDNSVSSLDEVLVEGQIAGRHNWVLSWIKKSVDSFFVSTAGGRWSIGWNML